MLFATVAVIRPPISQCLKIGTTAPPSADARELVIARLTDYARDHPMPALPVGGIACPCPASGRSACRQGVRAGALHGQREVRRRDPRQAGTPHQLSYLIQRICRRCCAAAYAYLLSLGQSEFAGGDALAVSFRGSIQTQTRVKRGPHASPFARSGIRAKSAYKLRWIRVPSRRIALPVRCDPAKTLQGSVK